MYRYVFFDLDGTLTQSEFGIVEAASRALAHFGIETPNRDLLKRFIGPPLYVSFHEFYGLSDEDSFEAIRVYREYYESEGVYLAPLFAGVKDMLCALKAAGCRMMIVTSKPQNMAEVVAEHEGVREYFESIVGPALEGRDPNKAVLIREAMRKMGISSENAADILMVGDRFYDIKAAVEVGIDSAGVLYGYGNEPELRESGATYIVNTPQEVVNIALGKD
ncbi:MAG: HAD hydrolase-like protein [Lachnospiraceae bacterium]|nr:HAD hydrolase-like protein [Lachnospiraceae bacterium]